MQFCNCEFSYQTVCHELYENIEITLTNDALLTNYFRYSIKDIQNATTWPRLL